MDLVFCAVDMSQLVIGHLDRLGDNGAVVGNSA